MSCLLLLSDCDLACPGASGAFDCVLVESDMSDESDTFARTSGGRSQECENPETLPGAL